MSDAALLDIPAPEYDAGSGCEPMLLFWYVEPGQPVAEGQDLCEIESAKAVVVITAPCSGTVVELLVEESGAVESGQILGRIRPEETA